MREDRDPQEVSSLKGKEHVTPTNNVQSTITLTQVNEANVQQPRDYVVLLSGHSDHVSKVTNEYSGEKIIIKAPIFMYKFGYLFPPQGFVKEVFRYYNSSPAQLHSNSQLHLIMLDEELTIRIFM